MNPHAQQLRNRILELVGEYYDAEFTGREFVPGESPVPVSGRVFDAAELRSLIEASLDFWLTTGRFARQFEREFAAFFGVRDAVLVNSGPNREPAGHFLPYLAQTGRTAPAPRGRGHYLRRRLPDDGQSHRSKRPRTGVRRCRDPHI